MTKLLLVRHAETDAGAGICYGVTDVGVPAEATRALAVRLAPSIPILIGGTVGPSAMGSVIGAGNVSDATDRLGQRAASPDGVSTALVFDSQRDYDSSVIGEQPRAVAALSDAAASRSATATAVAERESAGRARGKRPSVPVIANAKHSTSKSAGRAGGAVDDDTTIGRGGDS